MTTNLDRWRFYLKDVESPDIFINWGFYGLISAALQRRVWLYSDANKLPSSYALFANDFIVLVGKPSTGKGRVLIQVGDIIKHPQLQRAGTDGKFRPIITCSPDKITLEALTEHIARNTTSVSRKIDEKTTQNYGYSPCCILSEELEVLFSQNTNDMVAAITALYDSQNLHYKTKHQGEDDIKNVCVTMIAGTTPDSIRDLMQHKIIKKGMTSRCVMVFADAPRFYRQFPGVDAEQIAERNILFKHIRELTNLFTEVRFSEEAAEYHKSLYESGIINKSRFNNSPILDDYYGRKNIHWLKLMMILHYAEQYESNEIQKATVDAAWNVLQEVERRMHLCYQTAGRNQLDDSSREILRFLNNPENADGVAHHKIRFTFNKDLTKQDLEECLDFLVSTGQIRNNGGKYHTVRKQNEQ